MMKSKLNCALAGNMSTIVSGSLATVAIAGAMLLTDLHPAWAQQAVIARKADGPDGVTSSHMFVMPAFPNRFDALTRPDFARRDIPLFREHLNLEEEQMYVLEVLMDSYTEQFQAAVDDFRDVQKHYRLRIPGMDGEMFGGHMLDEGFLAGFGEMVHIDEHGEDGAHVIDFGDDMTFVMESPGTVSIGITQEVNVNEDVEVTTDGEGEPQVMVAFVAEDEDGESLLTEEQLQELTERISERIKERLAEIEAKRAEMAERRAAEEAARNEDPNMPAEEEVVATAQDVAEAGRKLIIERNRLRDELITDVNLLLNDEQKEKWPTFERTQRRISTMRFAEFGGERVDLLRIINEQQPKVADEISFEFAAQQYALELDRALKERNELLPEHEIELLLMTDEMIQSQSMDNEDRLDLMDRVGDARARVRDANLNAAREMEPLLAEESREEFRSTVLRRSYPHIYGGTRTQRSLEAALKFEDLDSETRIAIETLAQDYNTQLTALNDRIAEQIRKDEPREHRRLVESMDEIRELETRREAGEEVDFDFFRNDPKEKLMEKRRELNTRYMDQLHGLLTEEQIEQLPKVRRRMPFIRHSGPPAPPERGITIIESDSAPEPPQPPPPPKDEQESGD